MGVRYPSVQKVGVPVYPRTPHKLRLWKRTQFIDFEQLSLSLSALRHPVHLTFIDVYMSPLLRRPSTVPLPLSAKLFLHKRIDVGCHNVSTVAYRSHRTSTHTAVYIVIVPPSALNQLNYCPEHLLNLIILLAVGLRDRHTLSDTHD